MAILAPPAPGAATGSTGAVAGDVVVWRHRLIAGSETFIVDQAAALRRWRPRFAGVRTVPSTLDVRPDLVIGGDDPYGRVQRRRMVLRRRSHTLARLLRAPSVRLVHAHFGPDGVLVAPEARRAGVPLVVSFHGYDATRLPLDPETGRAYREQLRALFAQAPVLLAASDFLAARLRALGAPEHAVVRHYTGIPVPPFRAPGHARRVVFAGRLVPVKGVEDVLHAVAALPDGLRDTPVHLYGDGPLRAHLERRARELRVRAEFFGHRPHAEVTRALADGGVFCAPSRRSPDGAEEGLGTVYLEAAAAGLPVVAYRSGGVGEAVADGATGLLAPEGDRRALTSAVHRLLADPEQGRALGLAGRHRVEQRFDVEAQTAALERTYDRVAAGAGAPRGRRGAAGRQHRQR